ncbi:MAG: phage antirepressor KilAC domain-containing protein [Romboutsia sp.]|uniref:phage antirepressor KilAC domain-containing protein n=1 Tax=Romboutsia sp. TaxID=1965302 RepID=UPI003F2A87C3
MNNLRVFNNEEFGEVNVIIVNNKEYFEAITLAKILGYSNPRDAVIRLCEKDGVVFSDVGVVTGIKGNNTDSIQYVSKKFIDEGNVYRLIIKSKLPSAKKFEKWLMEEVLPSIRNNGCYMSDDVINKTLENPDFIIEMATKLKKEREEKLLQKQRADTLEASITRDIVYTNFAKSIVHSSGAITIGQFAKLLNNNNINIGRNRLFDFLRENGYLIKNGKEKNMPKQAYIEKGLFKISESIVNTADGEILSTTTLITGKGQMYFTDLLEMIFKKII